MPSERIRVKLGDVIRIKHGFAFKGEHFVSEATPHVLVTPGNFAIGGGFQEAKPKFYRGPVPPEYVLQPGDLIVTMTDLSRTADTLGYGAVIPKDDRRTYLHNQRIGLVEVTQPNKVSKRWLHYLMRTQMYRSWVIGSASGSTVKHTSPSRICDYEFDLPGVHEQQEVADTLDTLEARIDLLRQTNATLESIAQALFKSWFIDFDPVRAKAEGREPEGMDAATAALFPAEFDESALGAIPKGWKVGCIGDLADVIDCLHSKKPDLLGEGRPYLQLNNIRDDGLLDAAELAYVSDADYAKWTSRIEVREGDCVITNVGRVGAVAQIPPSLLAAMGRNMTAIRLRSDHPYPTVLVELLLSPSMRAEIERRTDVGTILNALNVRSIPGLQFVLAPGDVLREAESALRPLRASMESNIERASNLARLRDTLLPRLISGKLRLPEAQKEIATI